MSKKKPSSGLDAFVAKRTVKSGPPCRTCALPKELLEEIHTGRAKGYSFPAIEAYLESRGHRMTVDTHFRNRHHERANG